MVLTIMFAVFVVSGIVLILYDDCSCLAIVLMVLGGLGFLICIVAIFCAPVDRDRILLGYEQDRIYIESMYNEELISLQEREKVIDLILEDNRIINKFRVYSKSKTLNWFYSKKVAGLELFDITKIRKVKNEIILGE
jgi:hypothetical protein